MSVEKIGRYEIERELGRGGMAVVYLARDPFMKRQVAVKVLPRQFTFDSQFRGRFQREAEIIAALEHPHIVPVHDFGEHEDQPFIVMRHMTGGSLADRLRKGPLSVAETARIISRLASALDEAHSKGIVHRDLKPGNILFDARGEPYISDFGIAKLAETTASYTGTGVIGTPAYMSPEQARGDKDLDGRSDIYALGAMLFEILTGKLPYEADTPMGLAVKHITEPVPRILDAKPDLPRGCEMMIERAMAKDRLQRYQTAAELAQDVNRLAGGESLLAPVGPRGEPSRTLTPTQPIRAGTPSVTTQPKPAVLPTVPAVSPATQPTAKRASSPLWIVAVVIGVILCGALSIGAGALAYWGFDSGNRPAATNVVVLVATTPPPTGTVVAGQTEMPTPTLTPVPFAFPTLDFTPVPIPTLPPIPTADIKPRGRIVYVCFDENDDEICVINADGAGLTQLTNNDQGDFYASLSNDGRYIVFSRQIKGSNYEIFKMDADGSDVVQLTSNGAQNFAPAYSPDDSRIVWATTQNNDAMHIWVMLANGSSQVQLTTEGFNEDPSWSPDGRFISLASTRDGLRQLWVMNADGSNPRQVTRVDDVGGRSSWSPDGRRLAFYAGKRDDKDRNIYTINVDGTDLQKMTDGGDNLAPSYSPYGGWIVFTSFRDGDNELFIMRTDGGDVTQLTQNDSSDYQPRWGP